MTAIKLGNALLDHGAAFSLDRAATASISVCCLRLTSGAALVMGRLRVGAATGDYATTEPRASRLRRL